MTESAHTSGSAPYRTLLVALFLSGVSGLVNQIAWQRAIKIYLANSETLSSMIVVLVFMLGLGFGSIVAGGISNRLRSPLKAFGLVELALCLVNTVLILALGPSLRDSAIEIQTATLAAGISAPTFYAVFSFLVLFAPCFLMGLTIPIAAEAAQRQLGASRAKAVAEFFALNTFGAVIGTVLCGFLLMPMFGQTAALMCAALGNLAAGGLILLLANRRPSSAGRSATPDSSGKLAWRDRLLCEEVVLGFVVGAVSLGYEMYLFRVLALAYTPLPWIFSFVLCMFLLFWSMGAYVSSRRQISTAGALALTALSIALVPLILEMQRKHGVSLPIWSTGLVYFLPPLGFGILFGTTVGRYAKHWGRDVGVFTAVNTAGCAVGILVMTLVLFELDMNVDAWILALCLLAFVPLHATREGLIRRHAVASAAAAALLLAVVGLGLLRSGRLLTAKTEEFYGRDGVVEIERNGNVMINGLWHSVLFRDDDRAAKHRENVRRKMLIALLPFLVHEGPGPKTALNIGMGTGATARTLAKSPRITSVDAYEIVKTLQPVIAAYPEETMGTANLAKIHVYWEDARNGLITRDKQYDIITQSPLYLSQAGSSFLLSREYLELVKSRLKAGGVAGIYSNARGNRQQALLVRRTVSDVFRYCESFNRGYFIVASDSPIRISRATFASNLSPDDPIALDVEIVGLSWILERFDSPRLDWTSSRYVITDDHPLVEYPSIAQWLMGEGDE
jgi:spermidine synthase